jgi:hypothetical protein
VVAAAVVQQLAALAHEAVDRLARPHPVELGGEVVDGASHQALCEVVEVPLVHVTPTADQRRDAIH